MIDHEKYPIIVGAKYQNLTDNEIGVLESAVIYRQKNDAEIIIDMDDCGKFYKINYASFTLYWKILN